MCGGCTFFCKMGPCTVLGKGREVYFVGCKQWQRRETEGQLLSFVIPSGALFFLRGTITTRRDLSSHLRPCLGWCLQQSVSPNLFIVDSHFKFYFHVAVEPSQAKLLAHCHQLLICTLATHPPLSSTKATVYIGRVCLPCFLNSHPTFFCRAPKTNHVCKL